jgi:hypothetical protein
MALSEEEKATLAALQAKESEPDGDGGEDFDVEWWTEDESGTRKGGRVPWSTGKKMYGSFFPELFGEKPPEGEGGKPPAGEKRKPPSQRYFGRGAGQD